MFGLKRLSKEINEQTNKIEFVKDSISILTKKIIEMDDFIKNVFPDLIEQQKSSENHLENMRRFNSMINEFKGVLSQVRAESIKIKKNGYST